MAQVGAVVEALASLRPTVTVDAGACTRRYGSGCTRCVDACPQDALALLGETGAPRLDAQACVGCGVCVAECPADAVTGSGAAAPARVVGAAAATARAGGDLELRCAAAAQGTSALDDDVYTVDILCLGALAPEAVAAAAVHLGRQDGPAELRLVRADCDGCPVAAGRAVAERTSAAGALAARVAPAVPVRAVTRLAGQRSAPDDAPRQATSSRRRSRRGARRDAVQVSRRGLLTGLVRGGDTPDGDGPAAGLAGAAARGVTARDLLREVCPETPVPRPHVDERCTGCRACAEVCPTGALGSAQWSREVLLTADPSACTDCGECVRVCPEDAVGLVCELEAGPYLARVLRRVPRGRCGRCGAALVPGEQDECTPCASRRSILDDVWRQYGS